MQVSTADESHIPEIIAVARVTWHETYAAIISRQQINYMLEQFYAEPVLRRQMQNPLHHFSIVTTNDAVMGYSHCIEDETNLHLMKLSKLYILPAAQGSGAGQLLLHHAEGICRRLGKMILTLNVNRQNPAVAFYKKMGFEIVQEVDIPLGEFWLNDFVMHKNTDQ